MSDIVSALKSEISRVARRESRAETQALRKASAQYRSDIAALKRRVLALEAQLKRAARAGRPPAAPAAGEPSLRLRFSAAGLAAQRQRLGLSLVEMAALLGVSDQSVRKWEDGRAHPRAGQLPAIAAVRKMGRKQAAGLLSALRGRQDGA